MEEQDQFMIQFRNDDVTLDLVEQTPEKKIYRATRYNFDINADEKSSLTITVELSPITEAERRNALFFNLCTGKGNNTSNK